MPFRLGKPRHPRLELLKHVVLFKDLSWHDLGVIDSMLHERHYLAGEIIFDEGEEGQGLFIVLSGRVKTTARAPREASCSKFGPGSFFGEVALLDQSVRTAQARAIDDVSIVTLFRAEFYFACSRPHSSIAVKDFLPTGPHPGHAPAAEHHGHRPAPRGVVDGPHADFRANRLVRHHCGHRCCCWSFPKTDPLAGGAHPAWPLVSYYVLSPMVNMASPTA